MKPISIRWQLTLSYAAIALVAALALGGVLLSILRDYYRRVELAYVSNNALTIRDYMLETGALEGPSAALEGQLDAFAFLTRARIRLIDPAGRPRIDTGRPAQLILLSGGPDASRVTTMTLSTVDITVTRTVTTENDSLLLRTFPGGIRLGPGIPDLVTGDTQGWSETSQRELMWFNTGLPGDLGEGSAQQARAPLIASGKLLGYIELSEGPSYGREILQSVARGWVLASACAVVLATLAGWLTSRRISRPVLALAAATERMARGDLTARATSSSAVRELHALAHSFNEMADGIEATLLTLRQFISDAAHELHTPLTALRTDLELAIGAETDEGQQTRLRRAQGQVVRLQTLTDALLELSRVEAFASQASDATVDLVEVTRDAAEAQASRAEQAGVELHVHLPAAPLHLRGRAAELRSLVDNLIDNALKFTPAGGVVSVDLHGQAERAVLTVSDTGIGIPAEDLPVLFSRFHRGRNATAFPGNGLGLAIVKAVAEAHGGAVSAAPAASGAQFIVVLPLLNAPTRIGRAYAGDSNPQFP